MIANAHLAWADKSPIGARCEECFKLAELHSTAVDFCKSGVPAEFQKVTREEGRGAGAGKGGEGGDIVLIIPMGECLGIHLTSYGYCILRR